jgi:hypothetical protein
MLIGLSLASLTACKLRDGSSSDKNAPSDPNAAILQETDSSIDLSKTPVFVRCSSPKDVAAKMDLSIHHSQQTGSAQITYRIGGASEVSQRGRWDNHDEGSPYQYLYSFGDLRFILTNEQIFAGSYPATLVGNDSSGKYQEQTLACSKT